MSDTDWITPELKQLMAAMGGWAPPPPDPDDDEDTP